MNPDTSFEDGGSVWRRLPLTWVTLAIGLALAVSAAFAMDGSQSTRPPIKAPPASAYVTSAPAPEQGPARVVFYLVASAEQAELVVSAHAGAGAQVVDTSWKGLETARPTPSIVVFVAQTAEEEAHARRVIDGQWATIDEYGGQVTVVDWLRR